MTARDKNEFVSSQEKWIEDCIKGTAAKGSEVQLGTLVSRSEEQGFEVQVAWDFCTVDYLEANEQEPAEGDLRSFTYKGVAYSGIWRRAKEAFPPEGCFRVVDVSREKASKRTDLDHSALSLRAGQLADSKRSAFAGVDMAAIQAQVPGAPGEQPSKPIPAEAREDDMDTGVGDEDLDFTDGVSMQIDPAKAGADGDDDDALPRGRRSGGKPPRAKAAAPRAKAAAPKSSLKRAMSERSLASTSSSAMPPSKKKRTMDTFKSQLESFDRMEKVIQRNGNLGSFNTGRFQQLYNKLEKNCSWNFR